MLATAFALNTEKQHGQRFAKYTAKWSKNYLSLDEYNSRFNLWMKTDAFIKDFSDPMMTVAHNRFSDWTDEEKKRMLGKRPP